MTMPSRVWTGVHTPPHKENCACGLWSGLASTRSLEPAESLRVDVWTVWTP